MAILELVNDSSLSYLRDKFEAAGFAFFGFIFNFRLPLFLIVFFLLIVFQLLLVLKFLLIFIFHRSFVFLDDGNTCMSY